MPSSKYTDKAAYCVGISEAAQNIQLVYAHSRHGKSHVVLTHSHNHNLATHAATPDGSLDSGLKAHAVNDDLRPIGAEHLLEVVCDLLGGGCPGVAVGLCGSHLLCQGNVLGADVGDGKAGCTKGLGSSQRHQTCVAKQYMKTYENDTSMASARPTGSYLMAEVCTPLDLRGRLVSEDGGCRDSVLMRSGEVTSKLMDSATAPQTCTRVSGQSVGENVYDSLVR